MEKDLDTLLKWKKGSILVIYFWETGLSWIISRSENEAAWVRVIPIVVRQESELFAHSAPTMDLVDNTRLITH